MARNLSPRTLDTYLTAVDLFASHLEERGMPTAVANVRREHVEGFLAWMGETYKPASVRNRYTGIKRFLPVGARGRRDHRDASPDESQRGITARRNAASPRFLNTTLPHPPP